MLIYKESQKALEIQLMNLYGDSLWFLKLHKILDFHLCMKKLLLHSKD